MIWLIDFQHLKGELPKLFRGKYTAIFTIKLILLYDNFKTKQKVALVILFLQCYIIRNYMAISHYLFNFN